jgi:hypothetical protein
VLVKVILGLQKGFGLPHTGIKLNPLLVHRLSDPAWFNAGVRKPAFNGIDGILARCEEVVDLLWGVVLAVFRRVWVGSGEAV